MTMREGLVLQTARFGKRIASDDLSTYKRVLRDELVVSFPIDEAVLDFQTKYEVGLVSPAYAIWRLSGKYEVNVPFLKRFLRSPIAIQHYKAHLRGSTLRRRTLPRDVFLNMDVPLPELEEQRRIAAILDKADEVRAKRQQMLDHLDTLPQAIFHDMFGDLILTVPLGERCTFYSGGTPSKKDETYWQGTIPWFSPKDLKKNDLHDSIDHISDTALMSSKLRKIETNTIVVGVRGMILAHTFPVSVVRTDATINQDLKAVLPKAALDTDFLAAAIRAKKDWVLARVATSAHGTKKLDTAVLSALPIPDVSIAKQEEYARRISETSRARSVAARAVAESDELVQALQAKAFRQ
jgi:type I restriction enzyme S subunit